MKLKNYVSGQWSEGKGAGAALVDPVTGEELARASTEGVDYRAALDFARRVGGPALRALSFAGRAALLGKIADTLTATNISRSPRPTPATPSSTR
jgi:3,4-dehydroadipyl-CoA semialdehyde dehydrogenase